MGARRTAREQLIEDIHLKLKKENRQRAINKAQSEMLISQQERQMDNLKRKAKKDHFDTYQEMSTHFNLLLPETED